jgi:hypothetical protein
MIFCVTVFALKRVVGIFFFLVKINAEKGG